ncbi:MAG: PAS domain S-box protein [Spirochaetes bacterium]|nr:PAS domain S-box protein [Spirochaetota bacterium]
MMDSKQTIEILKNLITTPFFCKNARGEYLLVNASFERLIGSAAPVEGKKARDILDEDFAAEDERRDREALGRRGIVNYDIELGSGERKRTFTCRKMLLPGDGSAEDVIACVMNETTARVNTEEMLRKFSMGIDQSPASIIITDPDGIIRYVNATFTRVTGYPAEEAIGQNPRILKSGVQTIEFYRQMWDTIKSGRSWKGEMLNRTKGGSLYWEIASISPIMDRKGDITGFIAVKEDITHLKKVEEELRIAEEKNREILDAIPDIMFKMNRAGTILDPALVRKIRGIFPEEAREASTPYRIRAFETGDIQIFEYPVTSRDDVLYYEARFILSGEDEVLVIIRNITERVRAEREMREARETAESASRSKSDFLANMSHEIRTPLNSITGFIELLRKSSLAPEQEEYLDIISRSAESLVGIINDILDFSKIESGKIEIEDIPFNPFQEFEPTIEIFTERAQKKNIALYSFIDPVLPSSISGDPLRIKQVLVNLLSNAIKFTPEEGRIFVEIARNPGDDSDCGIRFSVRDTGIGIPERKRKLIFEAFSQADSSVTRRYGGTGLGLSISSNLISLMGSSLELESAPGRGSTFHFTLRLKRCEPGKARGLPADFRAIIHSPHGADAQIRDLLERYLTSFGTVPLHADSPGGSEIAPGREIVFLIRPADAGDEFDALAERIRAGGRRLVVVTGEITTPASELAPSRAGRVIHAPLNPSRIFNAIVEELDMPGAARRGSENHHAPGGARFNATALVAEDNPLNQKLITLLLKNFGITADVVSNGLDAFYRSGERRYDIIFMDVNMPVADGIEATQMILSRENETGNAHIPIVALTAMAVKGDRDRLMEAGMDDYISKPINTAVLESVLCRWLPRSQGGTTDGIGPPGSPVPAAPPEDFPDVEKTAGDLGIPPEVFLKIIVEFLRSSDEYTDGLAAALESNDMHALYQAAHKLKGAAANLRLERVAGLAERIEESAKKGASEDYASLVAMTGSRLEALKSWIDRTYKEGPST